jgi:hypothetical protein
MVVKSEKLSATGKSYQFTGRLLLCVAVWYGREDGEVPVGA